MLNNVSNIINNINIKQRKDGRYEGRITINNNRKSFYGKTKSEVKNKVKHYLEKVENGYKEPLKITFEDYAEYWFKTYKKGKIEPSSYTRLYRVFNSQIRDKLGAEKIGNVTTKQIQDIIDEYANPSDSSTEPLAISGLKKILQFIRPCMQTAVKEGIIQNNPSLDVLLPARSFILKETKKQYSLSDNEMDMFKRSALKKYDNGEYKSRNALSLLIILNLGLRAGEALALEWDNIDFENQLIYINKTLQCGIKNENRQDDENAYIFQIKNSTKTEAGNRILKLNDTVLFYLKEMKKYDKRHNIQSKYVCCNNKGKINNHRNLQKCLDRLCEDTNIDKRITLHTLRHTFGSTLIRRKIGIEVVSKLMGHANITITYNKYIHTIKEEEAKAMNMVKVC